jgi:hypothetical protein
MDKLILCLDIIHLDTAGLCNKLEVSEIHLLIIGFHGKGESVYLDQNESILDAPAFFPLQTQV